MPGLIASVQEGDSNEEIVCLHDASNLTSSISQVAQPMVIHPLKQALLDYSKGTTIVAY